MIKDYILRNLSGIVTTICEVGAYSPDWRSLVVVVTAFLAFVLLMNITIIFGLWLQLNKWENGKNTSL